MQIIKDDHIIRDDCPFDLYWSIRLIQLMIQSRNRVDLNQRFR